MLTDITVRQAKAKIQPYKISDSSGLYLLIKPTGKYWRMDYRFAAKRKTLAIGVYPAVSLINARKKRDQARELLAKDIDPSMAKAINKQIVRSRKYIQGSSARMARKNQQNLGRINRHKYQTLS